METAPNTQRYMVAKGAATYGIRMAEIRIFDCMSDAATYADEQGGYMRLFIVSNDKRPKEIKDWRS